MRNRLTLLAGAALAALAATAQPAAAQGAQGPANERIKQVIVYGNDPCPAGDGDEIVVCARHDEKERYRIPEELRGQPANATTNETWATRARSIEYVGRSGTQSCTPDGPGGASGCFTQLAEKAKAERKGLKSDWADKVAAERARRLSTIDADSKQIEEDVKAEEAAEGKTDPSTRAIAAPDTGTGHK